MGEKARDRKVRIVPFKVWTECNTGELARQSASWKSTPCAIARLMRSSFEWRNPNFTIPSIFPPIVGFPYTAQ